MMKTLLFAIILVLCLSYGCQNKASRSGELTSFFASTVPVLQIGSNSEVLGRGVYKFLWFYYIDKENNFYLSDILNFAIDKYDKDGNYAFSYGGKEHEVLKYIGWLDHYAVDSRQNL